MVGSCWRFEDWWRGNEVRVHESRRSRIMRMNCFGDKVRSLHCKIILLDEQQLVHEIYVSRIFHFLFIIILRCSRPATASKRTTRSFSSSKARRSVSRPRKNNKNAWKSGAPFELLADVDAVPSDRTGLKRSVSSLLFFMNEKKRKHKKMEK